MIAAGGTGGHVYPALAVAEALVRHKPDVRLFFVGTVGGFERPLIEKASVSLAAYDEVQAGPLNGVGLLRALISMVKLKMGTIQSLMLLWKHKPRVLLLTGGWVGAPVAMAAWLMRVPILIFLPDVEPGLTIQVLKRLARRVAINVPDSAAYFREGQAVVTGYPLRAAFQDGASSDESRQRAVARFELDPACKTLLVIGGSRGARSINTVLLAILPDLLADGIQVIHITGTLDWERVQAESANLSSKQGYHAYAYLHDIEQAYAVADLAVCRAGASVLGELPLFGLPSILVPYPYAWRYQKVNADYLAARGAAVYIADEDMGPKLLPTIRDLLADRERLSQMRASAQGLAQPDSAWRIGQELIRLAGGAG